MRKVIRNSCFETNSSSQHCIVVTKRDEHIDPSKIVWNSNREDQDPNETVYIYKGKWDLYEVEDGFDRWPFQILISFEEKFKYALCEYLGYLYADDPEWNRWYGEFERIAKKYIPGFKEFHFYTKEVDNYLDINGNDIPHKDLIYEGYDEQTHREIYKYKDKDGIEHPAKFDEENYIETPRIGMVDHQSAGLLKNFLKDKGISLEEFLTNKKFSVVIDGDEIQAFNHYIKSGFINTNFITDIYDKSDENIAHEEWLEREGYK